MTRRQHFAHPPPYPLACRFFLSFLLWCTPSFVGSDIDASFKAKHSTVSNSQTVGQSWGFVSTTKWSIFDQVESSISLSKETQILIKAVLAACLFSNITLTGARDSLVIGFRSGLQYHMGTFPCGASYHISKELFVHITVMPLFHPQTQLD